MVGIFDRFHPPCAPMAEELGKWAIRIFDIGRYGGWNGVAVRISRTIQEERKKEAKFIDLVEYNHNARWGMLADDSRIASLKSGWIIPRKSLRALYLGGGIFSHLVLLPDMTQRTCRYARSAISG